MDRSLQRKVIGLIIVGSLAATAFILPIFSSVEGEEKCLGCHTDEGRLKGVIAAQGLDLVETEKSSLTTGEG